MGFASSFDDVRATVGPLCVGLDPSTETLLAWGLPDSAGGALELSRAIIAGCVSRVGIVKPQVGYFERFGAAGYMALETVIQEARSAGLLVIADAKRGDIGTTMEGYASAWLSDGPLRSDAMTVSPYQGIEALEPAFAAATAIDGTVFVLAATSNPDAPAMQGASLGGRSLPSIVAARARELSNGRRTVGVVVGATRALTESGLTVSELEGTLVLAPGFGAQGAQLSDIGAIFGRAAATVIPSVSRSVVRDGRDSVARNIENHLRELGI